MTNNITNGITFDCSVFSESIGAEKDLILVNYGDFDLESTASIYNRQVDDSLDNNRGLSNIFLKPGAIQYVFEGTDYSVVPSVTPDLREDGSVWFTHSLNFTVYSKKSKDRETLISLSGSKVVAITKDRSTGLYELFGMYQGLMVSSITRTYTGAQNSNFYQVTIVTPEVAVIKEPSLSELSINLDNGVLPTPPVPGVYGDATPTVQGLVRVDTLRPNPIVYTVETADFKFQTKDNGLTTEVLLESNKTSTTKYPYAKAVVDWVTKYFEKIVSPGEVTQYYRGDKTWQTLNKNAVGLGNVDNTADADKPVPESIIVAISNISNSINIVPVGSFTIYKVSPNEDLSLQVGDVVIGLVENQFLNGATYNGGDPNSLTSFDGTTNVTYEPVLFAASTTGSNQVFTLPAGFKADNVYKSKGLLFKGTEWTQSGTTLTILINANINNSIYVTAK